MARPAEVSDDDIIAAGERILAASPKARVTGYSLRKALESGDPVRLEAVWRAHLDAKAPAAPEPPPTAPLPPALEEQCATATAQMADMVARLFKGAWSTADEIAQRRVADEQNAARDRIADADQRLTDANEVIRDADARASAEADRADGLAGQLEHAKDEAIRAGERYTALEDSARRDADLARANLEELSKRFADIEAAAARAREDAAAARATAEAARTEADRERQRVARLENDIAEAVDAKSKADAELTALRSQAEELKAEKSNLVTRLTVAEALVSTLNADLVRERAGRAEMEEKMMDAIERAARAEGRVASMLPSHADAV